MDTTPFEPLEIQLAMLTWRLFLGAGQLDPTGSVEKLLSLDADELRALVVGALACEVARAMAAAQ